MIRFNKNLELDKAFKNLILSMVNVNEYLTSVLNYNEMIITPKKEKEVMLLFKKYNIPVNSLKYNSKILTENPYYKNIKLNSISSNTVRYEKSIIKKRTLMNMNFCKPLGKYLFHYDPIGYFDTDVEVPALRENYTVWMSPAVSEIESMKDGIKKGHGKCLTMGLGMGVLPYLWLLKDDVQSVTIIEINENVIELFSKYILPQFNTKKDVKIIHGNAFDYYNETFLKKFDYTYVDFWESNEDGLEFYTKLMEKNINFPNIDYWIEDSILLNVKYIIVPYLNTIYEGKNIFDFMSSLDPISRKIAKKANKYFKSKFNVITTEDELLSIIHNKRILRSILSFPL